MTKKTIERIKSVILVVLVLITILLLYFFWRGISIEEFSIRGLGVMEETERRDALEAQDVIWPSRIAVCLDLGTTTVITEGRIAYWNAEKDEQKDAMDGILQCMRRFSEGENLFVEEITQETYQALMEEHSFSAVFDYYIPFGDFCDEFGIKKAPGYDGIDAMTALGYSEKSPESEMIYDGNGNRYYRLTATAPEAGFSAILADMMGRDYETYVLLSTVVGEGMGGKAQIPLELRADLSEFNWEQEFRAGEESEEAVADMAKLFFGDRFDFVRRIEEGAGAVTYMYGYGERILTAAADGTFEYKEEESSSGQVGYFEALDKALQFTATHGDFVTLGGQRLTPYLKKVVAEPD